MDKVNSKEISDALCKMETLKLKMIAESDERYPYLVESIIYATQFYFFIEKEKERAKYLNAASHKRLQDNIDLVVTAMNAMTNPSLTINQQWNAIRLVRYKASTADWVLVYTKKIVFTLCAFATGFILGAITGATVTGGIAGIPAAIFASIKAAAAIWGSAGAATVGLWPSFFGLILAKDQMAKETSSPVEREMLNVRKMLALQNRQARFCSIEKRMNQLLEAGANETHGIYPMLKTAIDHADLLHRSAGKWYTFDTVAKRTKSRELYQAVHQVLEQLTGSPTPTHFSLEQVKAFQVNINDELKTFDAILHTRRHAWADNLFSAFKPNDTHSQQIAHEAYHSNRNA